MNKCLKSINESFEKKLFEGVEDKKTKEKKWFTFKFKSGSNPYIAKTEEERDRIVKKYKGKVKEIKDGFYEVEDKEESLKEDTIKTKSGKWVNKGKEGTHGEFRTKKAADAQRKAMFAKGFKESLSEFDKDKLEDMVKRLSKLCNDMYDFDVDYIDDLIDDNLLTS